MSIARSEKSKNLFFTVRGATKITLIGLFLILGIRSDFRWIRSLSKVQSSIQPLSLPESPSEPISVTADKFEPTEHPESGTVTPSVPPTSPLFAVPKGFEGRVAFWVDIYSKYTSDDAVFHDARDLSIVYGALDLRPISQSQLHPFKKEFKIKKLIEKERTKILARLNSLKRNLSKPLSSSDKELFLLLGKPKSKAEITEAIANLRMQLGQKSFIEKALVNSDLYLPTMEKIFEKKGLPKELTRIPFVESSFNLAARSRVGASGIWQIMPATGRKLIPNSQIDYRNDPIKATEFAASLLKFNYKVIDAWPLAITAYNHGPTSIAKLTKRHKTKDLPTLINRVYGSHSFAFASSNFYACFLAVLEVERNREKYFPQIPRGPQLEFTTIQLKKPVRYAQVIQWFSKDPRRADQFNPHLGISIRQSRVLIPAGTYLYVPIQTELAAKDYSLIARRI